MTWQEYQEAAVQLYEQTEGLGHVHRNVFLPDKVTGQPRQIDVLLTLEAKGHLLEILIDAKFRKNKLNVRDVEGVLALSKSIGANKSVIVTTNGLTNPAATKAEFYNLDLRLLSIDEALDFIVEDKWQLCPGCYNDCLVLEHEVPLEINGKISVVLAGQCRECKLAFIWCWDCGYKLYIEPNTSAKCFCGHEWSVSLDQMSVCLAGNEEDAYSVE